MRAYELKPASTLAEAVEQAAKWFDEYQDAHIAKGTVDGDAKAERNAERAGYLRAALATPQPAEARGMVEVGGYAEAFYELAALMGIAAQPVSSAVVWREQMLPRLKDALSPQAGGEPWEGPLTAEEQAMIDGAWQKHVAAGPPCDVPPAGWSCTRGKGHEGPCAATPACPPAPADNAGLVEDMPLDQQEREAVYRGRGSVSEGYHHDRANITNGDLRLIFQRMDRLSALRANGAEREEEK